MQQSLLLMPCMMMLGQKPAAEATKSSINFLLSSTMTSQGQKRNGSWCSSSTTRCTRPAFLPPRQYSWRQIEDGDHDQYDESMNYLKDLTTHYYYDHPTDGGENVFAGDASSHVSPSIGHWAFVEWCPQDDDDDDSHLEHHHDDIKSSSAGNDFYHPSSPLYPCQKGTFILSTATPQGEELTKEATTTIAATNKNSNNRSTSSPLSNSLILMVALVRNAVLV